MRAPVLRMASWPKTNAASSEVVGLCNIVSKQSHEKKKEKEKTFIGIVWWTPNNIFRNKRFKLFLSCSLSASFICTSWFVKQEDCSKTCSNAGGTVKKTCECSSNSDAISERSVCENYGIKTTEMGKCKDLCRASGLQQGELFAISFLLSLVQ